VKIVETISALDNALETALISGKTIGFVPTMGALHKGHMALVKRAKAMTDIVVVSVFVNPTQFNNPNDLTLYPRTPEKDAALLAENGCDIAFFPTAEQIYPSDYVTPEIPLGNLDKVMEGEFRPGHFKGVVQVVNRLFELVRPTFAFFGKKDFQQVAVIQHMVRYLNLPVEIVPCPTLRELSGLAMSSRNMRLTSEQLNEAVDLYEILTRSKENVSRMTPGQAKADAVSCFERSSLELEYFTIVDPVTLEELTDRWVEGATACVAAFCGEVRLIDNMTLN
jgi:pantoate--beta-alanine ligase